MKKRLLTIDELRSLHETYLAAENAFGEAIFGPLVAALPNRDINMFLNHHEKTRRLRYEIEAICQRQYDFDPSLDGWPSDPPLDR